MLQTNQHKINDIFQENNRGNIEKFVMEHKNKINKIKNSNIVNILNLFHQVGDLSKVKEDFQKLDEEIQLMILDKYDSFVQHKLHKISESELQEDLDIVLSNAIIFYVDDEFPNQVLFEENIFGGKNININNLHVCNDGLDALKKLEQMKDKGNRPDIIFMDVKMPNMNGIEATEIIRGKKHNEFDFGDYFKDTPIIGQSAYSTEKDIDKGKIAGMTEYLPKPLDYEKKIPLVIIKYAGDEKMKEKYEGVEMNNIY